MNWRRALAVLLLLIGGVWILQGLNILKGSVMTGVGFWAGAGVVCVVGAIGLLVWDQRGHVGPGRSGTDDPSDG